jgi:hypothetical protein
MINNELMNSFLILSLLSFAKAAHISIFQEMTGYKIPILVGIKSLLYYFVISDTISSSPNIQHIR